MTALVSRITVNFADVSWLDISMSLTTTDVIGLSMSLAFLLFSCHLVESFDFSGVVFFL